MVFFSRILDVVFSEFTPYQVTPPPTGLRIRSQGWFHVLSAWYSPLDASQPPTHSPSGSLSGKGNEWKHCTQLGIRFRAWLNTEYHWDIFYMSAALFLPNTCHAVPRMHVLQSDLLRRRRRRCTPPPQATSTNTRFAFNESSLRITDFIIAQYKQKCPPKQKQQPTTRRGNFKNGVVFYNKLLPTAKDTCVAKKPRYTKKSQAKANVMDKYRVIKYPLTTESAMKIEDNNTLVFIVDLKANKRQIKAAVKSIMKSSVQKSTRLSVRTAKSLRSLDLGLRCIGRCQPHWHHINVFVIYVYIYKTHIYTTRCFDDAFGELYAAHNVEKTRAFRGPERCGSSQINISTLSALKSVLSSRSCEKKLPPLILWKQLLESPLVIFPSDLTLGERVIAGNTLVFWCTSATSRLWGRGLVPRHILLSHFIKKPCVKNYTQ